jgi:hypothetical protein
VVEQVPGICEDLGLIPSSNKKEGREGGREGRREEKKERREKERRKEKKEKNKKRGEGFFTMLSCIT